MFLTLPIRIIFICSVQDFNLMPFHVLISRFCNISLLYKGRGNLQKSANKFPKHSKKLRCPPASGPLAGHGGASAVSSSLIRRGGVPSGAAAFIAHKVGRRQPPSESEMKNNFVRPAQAWSNYYGAAGHSA
jgi:hypothetical protein